jgi:putative aldouronate transport system permease protein
MKPDQPRKTVIAKIKASGWLYLFLLPAALYIFVFRYIPIYGAQIAFRDYFPGQGILDSPWIGLHYFKQFINSYQFSRVMWNTVILSLMDVVFTFPIPIIFAIGLHYIMRRRFKKSVQMITYAPYFISTIVLAGIVLVYLSPGTGPVNVLLKRAGFEPIFFMGNPRYFRSIYVGTSIWQLTGYNAIIYIAVLSSVNPELHESALIDGASKLQRIVNIDFPILVPTTSVLLILRLGRTLRLGFEKAYALQTDLNISKSEIIETFVYKLGIEQAQFSYAAAVGLFMNVINFAILLVANQVTKKVSSHGLF